jgi:hypothetical protein
MKTKALYIALIFVLAISTVAMAEGFVFPLTTTVGVEPVVYRNWDSGDAAKECVTNLGYDFGLKIDEWDDSIEGAYTCVDDDDDDIECKFEEGFNNTITISNNDGQFFDWASSPFALGAVVVKGGNAANVFVYKPAAFGDTGLYSPINPSGDPADVSHASFCWNKPDDGDMCYQDETAWAVGDRYVKKGNWAMYVPYAGVEKTVDLRADGGDGVGLPAGTATFSAPDGGFVTITINLDNSFIFYYDLNDDIEDNNLKVQDYAKAPNKTPNPGGFAWKEMIPVGSTTATITVPEANFYGIHMDLAYQVPCE